MIIAYLMIFCVPEIFIVGDFSTQLTQLNDFNFKLTFSRTVPVIVVLLWSSFHRCLFLLLIISISACLCLQEIV